MYCNHCGRQVSEGARFCTGCGTRINYDSQPATPIFAQSVSGPRPKISKEAMKYANQELGIVIDSRFEAFWSREWSLDLLKTVPKIDEFFKDIFKTTFAATKQIGIDGRVVGLVYATIITFVASAYRSYGRTTAPTYIDECIDCFQGLCESDEKFEKFSSQLRNFSSEWGVALDFYLERELAISPQNPGIITRNQALRKLIRATTFCCVNAILNHLG